MLLAAGLAFLLSGQAVSQEVKIVVPNGWENIPGDSNSGSSWMGTYRVQYLIPASQFNALPAGMNLITQIATRPDESVVSPITWTTSGFQFRLSTTTADTLSTTYADNVGSDELVVYSGDLTCSTAGGPPGVKDFDYVANLQTPFFYDRSRGNLLLEEIAPQGFDTPPRVDNASGSELLGVATVGGDVTGDVATSGPFNSNLSIHQFTFVAQPSAADFDGDGDVDGDDFLTWQASFGVDDGGDTDDDGDTDGDDFLIWQSEFGSGSGLGSTAAPEPTSIVLLFVLAVVGMLSRRARS